MDFDLSEEQRLLQDSVAKLLADKYGFEQRKAYMKAPEGWSREVWSHRRARPARPALRRG
ncbi:hypothetical protein ACFQU2_04795 [Siccirubricoccus deserti]